MEEEPNKYLKQKWRQAFHFFDVTGDGKLNQEDFVQLSRNISQLASASSEETVRLTEDWTKWVRLLKPDSVPYLDIETYLRETASFYKDSEKHVEWNRTTATSLFDIIDLDKDGQISKEELTIFYQAAGRFYSKFIDGAFKLLDKDGAGLIKKDEFVSVFINYFTSPDTQIEEIPLFGLPEVYSS